MRKSEEKLARELLKQEEERTKTKRKEHIYSTSDINGKNLTIKDKFSMVKNNDSKNDKKDNTDYTKKENEYLLETPLPYSLASDCIPIEKVIDGVIKTEDNRYLRIVEVFPVNFMLKSAADQDSIIYNFRKYLTVAPAKIQIKSIAIKSDATKLTSKIDEKISKEINQKCIDLMEDYKALVNDISASEGVTRRFFMIVEHEKNVAKSESEKEIISSLNSTCGNIVSYLKGCGNNVNVPNGELARNDTVRFIYDILNRNRATNNDYLDHINDVHFYYKNTYGEEAAKNIPPAEFMAPNDIFFGKDYTQIDDVFYDFLFLAPDGYAPRQYGGWLSPLINAGDGIDVDIFIQKEDKKKMFERIGRKLRMDSATSSGVSASTTEYDQIQTAMDSGIYLKRNLGIGSEEFYYTSIMLTISASSIETLVRKKEAVISFLKAREMKVLGCDYLQKEAFESYLPICKANKFLFDRSKRNVLTSGLASFYPFTSFEICDPDGIFIGMNENGSMVVLDLFNTTMLNNANMSILGVAGAGKTYLLQLIATRLRRNDIQTFVIAPTKGHEFRRACNAIGGEFVTIAPSSNQCINIMEIRKKDTTAKKKLNIYAEESELAEKIQFLHIAFELLIPDITIEEDQLLDEAIINTYSKKGITFDNNSLFKEDGSGEYKEMPILGDLYNELLKNEAAKRVANIINRLVNGSARSFNNHTNVNLDNKYIVLDISPLEGSPLLPFVMLLVLDTVYSIAKEDITTKKAIIIDEAGQVIGSKSNSKAANYVSEIFRIIRGYGGSAICATQNYSDFMALEDGAYGKVILNNSQTKIILQLGTKEARSVQELLELSNDEYERIIHSEKGHGILSANGNNVPIHVKASIMENNLITTDRGENEKLAIGTN